MVAVTAAVDSSIILGVALSLGPIVLLGCIAYGLFGYDADTAQRIRAGESSPVVVIEEVRHVHVSRPAKFKRDRIDRQWHYVGLSVAAWGYSWSVFSGAALTSNVSVLDGKTRFALAACFLVGSSLSLAGSLMGLRIGRFTVLRSIRDNMTSAMLHDDIRLPYAFGIAGCFSVTISTAIYASTSFRSTTGSLGGWVTALWSAVDTAMLLWFWLRIYRYGKARDAVIATAIRRLELDEDDAG